MIKSTERRQRGGIKAATATKQESTRCSTRRAHQQAAGGHQHDNTAAGNSFSTHVATQATHTYIYIHSHHIDKMLKDAFTG